MMKLRIAETKILRSLQSLAVVLFACAALVAQSAKPISREGLEKALKLGGLQPAELTNQIRKRGVDFVLTPEVGDELRGLGAGPEVIEAVGANFRGSAASKTTSRSDSQNTISDSPARTSASTHSYPTSVGAYYQVGTFWSPLHQESTGWHKEGFIKGLKKISGGLIDAEVTGQIAGEHSPIVIHSPASLLIVPESGLTENDYIIVHMHSKHDNREFKTSVGHLHSDDQVAYHSKILTSRAFLVSFAQGSGSYAVLTSRLAPNGSEENHPVFLFTFDVQP